MSEPANWIAVAGGVESLITSVALIAGGAWAAYHYFYGRTHKPRIELHIDGDLSPQEGCNLLKARVLLRNLGLSKVPLRQKGTALRVFVYKSLPQEGGLLNADRFGTYEVFVSHAWVEPGEVIEDSLIVGLPSRSCVAARLEARIVAKKVSWEASTIVSPQSASSRRSKS